MSHDDNRYEAAFATPETDAEYRGFGLTKREYFAAAAMQGIIQARVACKDNYNDEAVAFEARDLADATLAALESES